MLGRVRLGTNGPLWSLSYEAAYYMMFGAAVFLSGAIRGAVIALVVVLAGLPVLLLMPASLLGISLHRAVAGGCAARLSQSTALLLATGAPLVYVGGLVAGAPKPLAEATVAALGPHDMAALGFSASFGWHAFVGALSAAHILGTARLLAGELRELPAVRWAAGLSSRSTSPTTPLCDCCTQRCRPSRLLKKSVAPALSA